MKISILIAFLILSTETTQMQTILDQYLWKNRMLLIFTPSLDSPLFLAQNNIIRSNQAGILERDIVISDFVYNQQVDSDGKLLPHLSSQRFYEKYQVNQDDFVVILVGKDGTEKLRKTGNVIDSNELFAVIDSMTMRQQEMLQQGR